MPWYMIKTTKLDKFKDFAKRKFKKYKIWPGPSELFQSCIFFETSESTPPTKEFVFQKLTHDLYKKITNKEINFIGVHLEDKKKVKIGQRVKVTSRLVTFNGKVTGVENELVHVKGKVFNKVVKLAIPREYIER